MHEEDHTARHFRMGPLAGPSVLGPIACWLCVYFAISLVFALKGIQPAGLWSIICTVGLIGLFIAWKVSRRKKNFEKAVELRSELHDLREQEFKLRYEEAKMNGQLDRWKKNDDHNDDE
ncbi:hypothetical protein [Planktotalea sp.]|uniref:hypothetical protein n=1 Tax=Planktotalea sp. TaxID=2029877 RepID=UPI003297A153